jgi:hypothetical protein
VVIRQHSTKSKKEWRKDQNLLKESIIMSKKEEQSSQKNITSNEDIAATVIADIAPGNFRKKSHSAVAYQYTGQNCDLIINWMTNCYKQSGINFIPWGYNKSLDHQATMVRIENGDMYLPINHWVIFNHKNKFYCLPPDLFEDTFESEESDSN